MKEWLYRWWDRQVLWYRFTHNKCSHCGKQPPMGGSTWCADCFAELSEGFRKWRERKASK